MCPQFSNSTSEVLLKSTISHFNNSTPLSRQNKEHKRVRFTQKSIPLPPTCSDSPSPICYSYFRLPSCSTTFCQQFNITHEDKEKNFGGVSSIQATSPLTIQNDVINRTVTFNGRIKVQENSGHRDLRKNLIAFQQEATKPHSVKLNSKVKGQRNAPLETNHGFLSAYNQKKSFLQPDSSLPFSGNKQLLMSRSKSTGTGKTNEMQRYKTSTRDLKHSSITNVDSLSISEINERIQRLEFKKASREKHRDAKKQTENNEKHKKVGKKRPDSKKKYSKYLLDRLFPYQAENERLKADLSRNCSSVPLIRGSTSRNDHKNIYLPTNTKEKVKTKKIFQNDQNLCLQKTKNGSAFWSKLKKDKTSQLKQKVSNGPLKKSILTPKETRTTDFSRCPAPDEREYKNNGQGKTKLRNASMVVPLLSPEQLVMRNSIEKVRRWMKTLPKHFDAVHSVSSPTASDY